VHAVAFPGNESADFVGDEIQGDEGQRIGVQRGEHCDRQVDAKRDGENCRKRHLHRAGNQAGEQAHRHAAGDGMAVQVPQVGVVQHRTEQAQVTVSLHAVRAGQKFSEVFSRHDK